MGGLVSSIMGGLVSSESKEENNQPGQPSMESSAVCNDTSKNDVKMPKIDKKANSNRGSDDTSSGSDDDYLYTDFLETHEQGLPRENMFGDTRYGLDELGIDSILDTPLVPNRRTDRIMYDTVMCSYRNKKLIRHDADKNNEKIQMLKYYRYDDDEDDLISFSYDSGSELDSDDDFGVQERFDLVRSIRCCEIPSKWEIDGDTAAMMTKMEEIMDKAEEALPGVDLNFNWSDDFGEFKPQKELFSVKNTGPTKVFRTPYSAFIAIWNESIMEHIAAKTNQYVSQCIGNNTQRSPATTANLDKWVDTSAGELYNYLSVVLATSGPRFSSEREFWLEDTIYETPGIPALMDLERYELLSHLLYFSDDCDSVPPHFPKLSHLQPIIDHCNAKFEELYVPGQHLSIAESLTLWRGRLSWVSIVMTKAIKFGVKSFELCESTTGYLWRLVMYSCEDTRQSNSSAVMGLAEKKTEIVQELLKGLENKGYSLSLDNFHNSPVLARYLKSRGFDCMGTLRPSRRHVPDDIKLKKSAPVGTFVARHSGDLCALVWKNAHLVTMISTNYLPKISQSSKARRPKIVREYVNCMKGLDVKDKVSSSHISQRVSPNMSWYIRMFNRIVNASVHNAYILHRSYLESQGGRPPNYSEFRHELLKQIARNHCKDFADKTRLRRDVLHAPKSLSETEEGKCVGCSKTVQTMCKACNTILCFGKCWSEFHRLR